MKLLVILLFVNYVFGNVMVFPFRDLKTNTVNYTGMSLKYYVESLLQECDSKLDKDFIVGLKSSFKPIDPVPSDSIITGYYIFENGKWKVFMKIHDTKKCTGKTYCFEGNSLKEVKSEMKELFTGTKSSKKEVKKWLENLKTIEDIKRFKDYLLSIPSEEYDWEMFFLLGEAYRSLNEYDEACNCYDKALSMAEDDYHKITVLISIGIVHRQKKEYDKALEVYDKALKLCKDETQKSVLLNNKANVLYLSGQKKEAFKLWREALKGADPKMRQSILLNLQLEDVQ